MKEFIENNIEDLNIEIIKLDEYNCTYKCLICNAIKTNTLGSMSRQYKQARTFHTEACSKYHNDIIKDELGDRALQQFRRFYRYARERCCNPNSKDYIRYKGKFKFNLIVRNSPTSKVGDG